MPCAGTLRTDQILDIAGLVDIRWISNRVAIVVTVSDRLGIDRVVLESAGQCVRDHGLAGPIANLLRSQPAVIGSAIRYGR
jgi:hypothetical protein